MQGFGANTFLLLSPHASLQPVKGKIQAYVDRHMTAFSEFYRMQEKLPSHHQVIQAGLTALADTHFDTRVVWPKVNNPLYAYILTALGVLILLVACINYVSLTLTTAASRLREIGMRKVMGASRWQVIGQLWAESQVVVWGAMLLSIDLVYLFLPVFNSFTGKRLHFALWQEPLLVAVLSFTTLLVGIAAGGYPAVVLSNFQASKLLKGSRTYRINPSFSKVLLLLQYSLCLF